MDSVYLLRCSRRFDDGGTERGPSYARVGSALGLYLPAYTLLLFAAVAGLEDDDADELPIRRSWASDDEGAQARVLSRRVLIRVILSCFRALGRCPRYLNRVHLLDCSTRIAVPLLDLPIKWNNPVARSPYSDC